MPNTHNPIECPKCNYVRQPEDYAPEWQCPKCQIAYAKYRPNREHPTQSQRPHNVYETTSKPVGINFKVISSGLIAIFMLIVLFGFKDSILNSVGGFGGKTSIEVFTSNGCEPCIPLLKFLDEYGVDYTEYNVDQSEEIMDKFRRHKKRSVPLTIIGREKIEGYYKTRIMLELDKITNNTGGSKEVVMYTKNGCSYCVRAKEFFDKYDVEVTEYYIDKSMANYEHYTQLQGTGTPLIFIGKYRVDGFEKDVLKKALIQLELI